MVVMKRFALVALLGLFALGCGALGVHAQTLSLVYKKGDTFKYGMHMTTQANIGAAGMSIPVNIDLSGQETVTVNSVDSSGNADLSIALSNLTLKSSANGITNTTTGTPAQTVEMTIAPDGRVLSVNGQAFGGTGLGQLAGGTGGSFISAVLPSYVVKPGDTWSKSYDIANPLGTGTVHLTADSKYLRDESLKGVNAAVVETKTTGTFNLALDTSKLGGATGSPLTGVPGGALAGMTITGTTTADTTTWIDPSGHRAMQSHNTGTTNATLSIQMAAGSTSPMLTGPITITANQTMDLTPA
jgi:hypothetical protein